MANFAHPGITMVENLRNRGDRDDQQIQAGLHEEKSALNLRMAKVEPQYVDPKEIQLLRGYEVAIAYIGLTDLNNHAAANRLRDAIKGYGSTGEPDASLQYAVRRENALIQQRVSGRGPACLDF